jgi:hypothetical protein
MANRKTHAIAGFASGAVAAGYSARDLGPEYLIPEIISGGIGGMLGGIAPDVLEPAIHSWHSSVAHSGASGLTGAIATKQCATLQKQCRLESQHHDQLRHASENDWTRFWHAMISFLWLLLSGLIVGLPAGYLSHLVLDAASPRGIPLVA